MFKSSSVIIDEIELIKSLIRPEIEKDEFMCEITVMYGCRKYVLVVASFQIYNS